MMNLATGGFENGGRAQSGGRTLHNLLRIVFALFMCADAGGATQGQRVDVPMVSDRWQKMFGNPEFKEHKGAQALVITAEGAAKPGDHVSQRDDRVRRRAGGDGRRARVPHAGPRDVRDVYFRPQANCASAPDCMQYAPFTHKVLLWDMFPQYQSPAPLRQNEWNHVKVVISGRRMNVFVNGAASPTLAVGSLEGDAPKGDWRSSAPAHLHISP